ncbi:hypothetical protein VCRA2121O154_50126 [Vibrio crassostreae]|nr:hypothetical protein VCRA2111O136_30192 [Vibrio crassostreae]CAK3014453.1 hypothetical protein VCRA2121O154_50126 [Vibrio crassostreae]CAK3017461.1 hypothetical protein VCRA2113O139_50194 [Vibrio crassostreae]CAK3019208.1 hypothetical protein VCRA2119O148_50126 [Vibrio crassostreae]CAK3100686.1 hypothetical protein VCRA2127O160_50194 [Vibrio crassostreae]
MCFLSEAIHGHRGEPHNIQWLSESSVSTWFSMLNKGSYQRNSLVFEINLSFRISL